MTAALPIIALIASYVLGSIPTGLLLGRMKGIDLRRHGSGNVGATNAMRVLGRGWGALCLLFDLLKGWLLVTLIYSNLFGFRGIGDDAWRWMIGLAAIAGHMFSPFLKFRGGKGVATSIGVLLAISPLPLSIAVLAGLFIVWYTGFVSLASMTCASLLPVLILLLSFRHPPWTSIFVTLALAAVIIWKHRDNIQRLRNGTEGRIFDRLDPK